jgi:cation transport ATPase
VLLGQYLAGSLVVLMLSGGHALESFAVGRASSALKALARRMPSIAHRPSNGTVEDVALDAVTVGDHLTIFPHEICPVDGTVIDGHGSMDESYLTGEPFVMAKGPGSEVLSGAINGGQALVVRAIRPAVDSRYARIMTVMRESEQHPSVLEQVDRCRTIVLDKTGTLTYGEPTLTDRLVAPSLDVLRVLQLAASLERYSRHPLAAPILTAARADRLALLQATDITERPGEGLEAVIDGQRGG